LLDFVHPAGGGGFDAGPAAALAFEDAGGVVVGITAGEWEVMADEVLGPAGLGGDDEDILGFPDRQG
jgi:hypothetical protein